MVILMHLETKTSTSYLILYILTTSFYTSRILSRYLYELTGKYGWLIILLISLFTFITRKKIYRFIQKPKRPTIFLYAYLLTSSIIALIFLMTLINASWLVETRYTYILLPFFIACWYLLKQKREVFLRFTSLCMIPIVIQYLIFLFSKNKSLDVYALIPTSLPSTNLFMLIMICLQLYMHFYLGAFYLNECKETISQKQFTFALVMILVSQCIDSIIITSQFGVAISIFPFVYYESWCLVNFGQYLGYLDIFAFFYWIISTFIYVSLCLSIIKKYHQKAKFKTIITLLFIVLIFILTNASLYPTIKPLLLIASSCSIILCLMGGKTNENLWIKRDLYKK